MLHEAKNNNKKEKFNHVVTTTYSTHAQLKYDS